MTLDGFAPFVPRVVTRRHGRASQEEPACASSVAEAEPAPEQTPSTLEVASLPAAIVEDDRAEHRDDGSEQKDDARTLAAIREQAINIAGEACARALQLAVARNPLFVARFVDAAIEAAGRGGAKTVRLSPVDAAACHGRTTACVVADESVARGEVIVETADGTVGATMQQRAQILVRSVAG